MSATHLGWVNGVQFQVCAVPCDVVRKVIGTGCSPFIIITVTMSFRAQAKTTFLLDIVHLHRH